MAASDNHEDFSHRSRSEGRLSRECLSTTQLCERLDEEVARAERQGAALSCLLVSVDRVDRLLGTPEAELPERALAYLGTALERQLRRFDRVGRLAAGELLVLLPGADEQRAEIVARRALGRLHAVKVELEGVRRPLHVSIGIAAWRAGGSAGELIERVRLAAAGAGTSTPPQRS